MDTPINNAVPYPINTNDPVLRNDIPNATFSKLEFPTKKPFDIKVTLKELEPNDPPIEHQWRVFQTDITPYSLELTVRGGTIEGTSDITAEEKEIDVPVQETSIWCKITLNDLGDATKGEIDYGDEVPEDTPTEIYRLIAEIINRYPNDDFFPSIRQIQFEPIRILKTEGEIIYHPWKVTYGGSEVPEGAEEGAEPVPKWNYAGGEIYTQGTMQTVADGTLSGAGPFVVLSFVRDIETREINPYSAEVTLRSTVPDSDYYSQYRVLAKINAPSSLEVLQLQFEEIRIYEELVIENGEFKLQGYEVSHRNNYQPPT
jgi:hypothetical protein